MKKRNRNRNRNRNQAPAQNSPVATPLTKADIARINGAKSHGPTTPEGKARSSQNAIKHGLTAKKFMGTPEEQAEFDLHLTAAIMHWAPKTDYELYLVTKIARAASPAVALAKEGFPARSRREPPRHPGRHGNRYHRSRDRTRLSFHDRHWRADFGL